MPVWYLGYGSNLSRTRFARYLAASRDPSPPAGDRAAILPGTVWFGGWSRRWGGAVAFYDPSPPGRTLARAWLVDESQLADVAAQECGLAAGAMAPIPAVAAGERAVVHAGRYGTVVGCAPIEGLPAVTLTTSDPPPEGPPSLAYLRTIATGLGEAHDLDPPAAAAYLAARPGAAGVWPAEELAAALRP